MTKEEFEDQLERIVNYFGRANTFAKAQADEWWQRFRGMNVEAFRRGVDVTIETKSSALFPSIGEVLAHALEAQRKIKHEQAVRENPMIDLNARPKSDFVAELLQSTKQFLSGQFAVDGDFDLPIAFTVEEYANQQEEIARRHGRNYVRSETMQKMIDRERERRTS